MALRLPEQKVSLERAAVEFEEKDCRGNKKRPAVAPASPYFTIRVASVAASAIFPIVGTTHGEVVGGSVSRRGEIGNSNDQAQDGQGGERDCLHGNSLLDDRPGAVLLLRQPLRASADGWESGRWAAVGAEALHTSRCAGLIGQKKPQARPGLELEEKRQRETSPSTH